MNYRRLVVMLVVALIGAVVFAGPAFAAKFSTTLTGAALVPGPGDPDGTGTATINVKPGKGELCYELSVTGIAPAIGAGVHVGDATTSGTRVVPLTPPDPTTGSSGGCVAISRELAKDLTKNPQNYYVLIRNVDYSAGALRGQLSK
jgi:hypothetical protein